MKTVSTVRTCRSETDRLNSVCRIKSLPQSCWHGQTGRDECGSVEETQMKHEVWADTEEEEDGSSAYERASRDNSDSSSDRLIQAKNFHFHPQPNKCQVTVCACQRRFTLWLNTPWLNTPPGWGESRAAGWPEKTNPHLKNCCPGASKQRISPPNCKHTDCSDQNWIVFVLRFDTE